MRVSRVSGFLAFSPAHSRAIYLNHYFSEEDTHECVETQSILHEISKYSVKITIKRVQDGGKLFVHSSQIVEIIQPFL